MGGMMNRYFYGKAGQADYTVDKMPATRMQLFFSTLRARLGGLVGVNLLTLLFAIPLAVWFAMNLSVVLTTMENYMDNLEPVQAQIEEIGFGDIADEYASYEEGAVPEDVRAAYEEKLAAYEPLAAQANEITDSYRGEIKSYLLMFLLVAVPCLMLLGIGKTGQMYILRNWARDDHSFVISDFKDALKGNWKYGLLTGFIDGFSLLIAYVCYVWYGSMADMKSAFFTVPQVLIVVLALIWWMMRMVMYPMMVTYDSKYKQLMQNSMLMVLARLPFSVLAVLASLAVPLIIAALTLFWNFTYGLLILLGWMVLLGFSFPGFIQASYANSLFDKYLNPRIEGAEVNKGLRPDVGEDEDDDIELTLDGRTLEEARGEERK